MFFDQWHRLETIPSCLPTHRQFVAQLATDVQDRRCVAKKPHTLVEVTGTLGPKFQTNPSKLKDILRVLDGIPEGWTGKKLSDPSAGDHPAINKAWANTVAVINNELMHNLPRTGPLGETIGAASVFEETSLLEHVTFKQSFKYEARNCWFFIQRRFQEDKAHV